MHYTRLFRNLREAKGLTLDHLARLARCHRNTVVNVESGRPVKFKTIARLMIKMGYPAASPEMKSIALLWLESVSGLPFSQPDSDPATRDLLAAHQATRRDALLRLADAVDRARLSPVQIDLLLFAARQPAALAILAAARDLATTLQETASPDSLQAAEPPPSRPKPSL